MPAFPLAVVAVPQNTTKQKYDLRHDRLGELKCGVTGKSTVLADRRLMEQCHLSCVQAAGL